MRIAIVTTSYPAEPGDPCGHFVQAEARARASSAEVVVITASHESGGGGGGSEPHAADRGAPQVHALDGGGAFGWPGVAARVRERPARALAAAAWMRAARRALTALGPFDRIVAHWALPCAWPVAHGLPGAVEIASHGGDVRALLALPAVLRAHVAARLARAATDWRFVSRPLLEDLLAGLRPEERRAVLAVARIEACAIELPDVREAIAQRRAGFLGKPLYVCVGRLIESKRVDRVIDHVAERPEPSTLVVVGDGPERTSLERRAAARRIDARFVGKTSRPEALAWMGAADALVHASEAEGLSTVVREAHALGVRVVTLATLMILVVLGLTGCSHRPPRPSAPPAATSAAPASALAHGPAASVAARVPSQRVPVRDQIHGHDFPDGVLAMTWDDGPDDDTVALARYLAQQHVPATFFVVGGWVAGLSSDPGSGPRVFQTGTHALPVLRELLALGHRIGNHTENHVLLDRVSGDVVTSQLERDQQEIDPFETGGLRFFRVPGGAWGAAASAAVDADPALRALTGPIAWDFDERDWDGSLWCTSDRPTIECEAKAPGGAQRVKPQVMAERYAADIERYRRGIVLLHDRVGQVGSGYALDLARTLVPRLLADGFVFVAPVLRFGAPEARTDVSRSAPGWVSSDQALVADLNGDGRADSCARRADGIYCALGKPGGFAQASKWAGWAGAGAALAKSPRLYLADVSHDRRADLCAEGRGGSVVCALSP